MSTINYQNSRQWINEYGDLVDENAREDFIEDEMCSDEDATGIPEDRANAERVFNQTHTPLLPDGDLA